MRVLNCSTESSAQSISHSMFDFKPFKSDRKSTKPEQKLSKPESVSPKVEPKLAKAEVKSPETKAKKLFPRNPIQNLIKFYESPEKPVIIEESDFATEASREPVVLEDKYSRVLFQSGPSPSPSRTSFSPSMESSPHSSDTTRNIYFLLYSIF